MHPSAVAPRSDVRRHQHRLLSAALALALTSLICSAPVWASAQPVKSTPPQLSIAVDNGVQATDKGDKLTYAVTVTNLGSDKIEDLVVTQTVPVGSTFVSADSDGAHAKQAVSWELNLKATKKVVLHTSLKVASTPDSLLRLATVVCAQVTTKGTPIVCASDSDLLPAGAAAELTAVRVDPASWGQVVTDRRWWFGGAGLVGVIAAGAVLLPRRRGTAPARSARSSH